MELWVPITLVAAFMQNLRSALQKHLKDTLSTYGATFCRFVYAAPLALVYVAVLGEGYGFEWPEPNPRFVLFSMLGGVTQITATALLVYLFSLRNFAVGTTYSKTETVQTAIFGLVILGEPVSSLAAVAIVISLVGVMSISVAKSHLTLRNLLLGWTGRAAFIGILSGTFFGLSAVSYRAAALSLGGDGFLMQAAFTLACVVVFQTAVMAVWIRVPGARRAHPGVPRLEGRFARRDRGDDRLGRLVHRDDPRERRLRAGGGSGGAGLHLHRLVLLLPRALHPPRDRRDPAHRRRDRHPAPRLSLRRRPRTRHCTAPMWSRYGRPATVGRVPL